MKKDAEESTQKGLERLFVCCNGQLASNQLRQVEVEVISNCFVVRCAAMSLHIAVCAMWYNKEFFPNRQNIKLSLSQILGLHILWYSNNNPQTQSLHFRFTYTFHIHCPVILYVTLIIYSIILIMNIMLCPLGAGLLGFWISSGCADWFSLF